MFIFSAPVYTSHCAHVWVWVHADAHYVCLCVFGVNRFNLLGETSVLSGQYQFFLWNKMEAGWGELELEEPEQPRVLTSL